MVEPLLHLLRTQFLVWLVGAVEVTRLQFELRELEIRLAKLLELMVVLFENLNVP